MSAIAKADRVKKLLDDPDLQKAFQDVRKSLHDLFEQCSTTDADTMLDIRKRLHLLDSIEANLRIAIQEGELESFRLSEQERPPFLGDILKWKPK